MRMRTKFKEVIVYLLIFFGYYKTLFYQANSILLYIQYIFIGITIIYMASILGNLRKVNKPNSIIIFLILFFILVFTSVCWTSSTIYVYEKVQEIFKTIIYCFILYIISNTIDIIAFLKITYVLNLWAIILYSIINLQNIMNGFDTRIGSVVGDNPIWVARLCCITILAMIILDLHEKNKFLIIRICEYIFVLFVAFRTGSKGPWIALIICILTLGFDRLLSKQQRKKLYKMFLFIAFGVVLLLTTHSETIYNFLYSRFSTLLLNVKGYRMHMYLSTIEAILKRPIKGYGLASWPLFYGLGDSIGYPHNILLECWFECGIFSLSIFLVILIIIFLNAKYNNRLEYHVFLSFFLFEFISAMFSGSLFGGNRGIFIFIVLLAVNYSMKRDNKGRIP